jgi:peptide/nickel transport system substrate-binding protein
MGENMKRFLIFLVSLAAILFPVAVFAGGRSQSSAGGGASSQRGGDSAYLTVENTDINDTTADVDVSRLTLKGASGLPGNVKDRLPKVPKLVNEMPADLLKYQIGKYGGTMRFVTAAKEWDADVFIMCNEPLLNTPGILGREVTGNVLRGYTVSPDQKEFTFYMREGLKWSDGAPVTMEDVRFTVEDVIFNEIITPSVSNKYRSGGMMDGTPMKFQIVDDWTFKITFDRPYGGFLIAIAISGWVGYTDLLKPAHYLKPYHIKYATTADKARWPALLRQNGFSETDPNAWANLFNKLDITNWELCRREGIGFPKLYPWVLVSATDAVYTYERNPYYFKIDSAGNQLPYVDKVESYQVENMEMVQLKMISGEVDVARESATMNNIQLYKQNERNGYTSYIVPMHMTPTDIAVNLTWGDAEYRSIVNNLKFRQALNKAIDRNEIIDALYYGYAEPATDYSDPAFDPGGAERLLQEIGMRKGPDGYYRTPTGKPFEIIFEMYAEASDIIPCGELVTEMWKAIGINTTVRRIDNTVRSNKRAANEIQATVNWTHTPLWYYQDFGMFMWGRAWEIYFNNTATVDITNEDGTTTRRNVAAETPPPAVMEFQSMVASLLTGSLADANETFAKVKKNIYDNLWYIVPLQNVKQVFLVNSRIRNVAEGGFAIALNYSGETFWYDN